MKSRKMFIDSSYDSFDSYSSGSDSDYYPDKSQSEYDESESISPTSLSPDKNNGRSIQNKTKKRRKNVCCTIL